MKRERWDKEGGGTERQKGWSEQERERERERKDQERRGMEKYGEREDGRRERNKEESRRRGGHYVTSGRMRDRRNREREG